MYSITPILHHHVNLKGLSKVIIQVIYKRKKIYAPTAIKLKPEYWENGQAIKHPNKTYYNNAIREQVNAIERRMLDRLKAKSDLTKTEFNQVVNDSAGSSIIIEDFITILIDELKGKFSDGVLRHYKSIANRISEFGEEIKFTHISVAWLERLEDSMRSQEISKNTLNARMKLLKGILNKACVKGLINKEQFQSYKVPKYDQKIPVYLTETEIGKLYDFLQLVEKPGHKLAGFYYLLACYAGYRISDLKRFNYAERVRDGRIQIRAKKNGEIVSIAIHSRLQQVLDYIHDKPLYLSEQKVREYVKEMASLRGFGGKITPHTGRHSFGMLLAGNGFSLEEAAELLGDTLEVARIYFRITNLQLDAKVRERLG